MKFTSKLQLIIIQMFMIGICGNLHTLQAQWSNPDSLSNIFYNGGNVGIGTINPFAKLHVLGVDNDGATASMVIQAGTQQMLFDGNEIDGLSGLHLNNNTDKNVSIVKGGGNMGVGTLAPGAKLHVLGVENDGSTASMIIQTGTQQMLFDGNEIDGLDGLYLNKNTDKNVLVARGGGNMGIGTHAPGAKLHIIGADNDGSTASMIIQSGSQQTLFDGNEIDGLSGLYLNNNTNTNVSIARGGGGVRIGAKNIPAGYKLSVDGKVICEELKVQLSQNWPDYVFQEDYDLPTLKEVAASIETLGHLPGIPSAASIEAEGGIEIGEMQRKMMEKIEELTLYMIDMSEKMEKLEKENAEMRSQIANH